jgi:hypothetical protein
MRMIDKALEHLRTVSKDDLKKELIEMIRVRFGETYLDQVTKPREEHVEPEYNEPDKRSVISSELVSYFDFLLSSQGNIQNKNAKQIAFDVLEILDDFEVFDQGFYND